MPAARPTSSNCATDPPVVHKRDLDASPILSLAVSGNRDSRELYVLADRNVKNVIESAQGVGQVFISGAADRAVQVSIEARRLAAYQLSIMQVRRGGSTEYRHSRRTRRPRASSTLHLGRVEDPARFPTWWSAPTTSTAVRLRPGHGRGRIEGSSHVGPARRQTGRSARGAAAKRHQHRGRHQCG